MKNNKTIFATIPKIVCGLMISLAFAYAVISTNSVPFDAPMDIVQCYDADFDWKTDSGKNVVLPYYPKTPAGKITSISAALPDNVEDNMVLFLRVDQLDINVYIDDVLELSYSTKESRAFGKISPRRYLFVDLQGENAGKTLRIDTECAVNELGKVDVIQYGMRHDIEHSWIKSHLADVAVAGIMLIICAICLVTGIMLSISYKKFFEVIHLTIMGMLASVWILCNSEISQIIMTNCSVSTSLNYMMLLLLPFPFSFFMNSTQKFRYDKIYRAFEYIIIINVVVCTVLQVLSIADYSQLFPLIVGVFGSVLIMILITIGIDVFGRKDRSYLIIATGILAGILATIVQVVLFAAGVSSFGGKAVGYALIIILFATGIDTFNKVKKVEEENQMAVAQGKAESRFLANMSHEIRTPINAVLGMNEMILRETQEDNTREYAENIESSGRMLLSIVNDILDFSKSRTGNMKIIPVKYSLVKTVNEFKDMIGPRAMAKSLIFITNIEKTLPNNLIGDDVRVKQIIINLLSNAVKYTDNGKIELKIEGESRSEDKVSLKITVSDTGKGIKAEDKDSLFAAFTRVDEKNNRNIEGTGLGLALVSQLVTAMEGTIDVESTYGEGSSFIVTIPQGVDGNETVEEAEAALDKTQVKKPARKEALFKAPTARLLAVDDTAINLTVIKGLLKRTEIDVTTASNGEQCIELLRTEKYDVVLIDHLMPVMDGVETLSKIKEEKLAESTPILIFTANAVEGSREKYVSMGFDDYISKPVVPAELEDTLIKYIPKDKLVQ